MRWRTLPRPPVEGTPLNEAPPTVTGTAQQGKTLEEVHGKWSNSPTGYAYQWLQCDGAGANCKAITGATSQSYVPVEADVGHALRVEETASNAAGAGKPATSLATAAVLPAAPVNEAPPTIKGTAQQGKTLEEAHGKLPFPRPEITKVSVNFRIPGAHNPLRRILQSLI